MPLTVYHINYSYLNFEHTVYHNMHVIMSSVIIVPDNNELK